MALLDDLIARFSALTSGYAASTVLECAIASAHTDMSRRARGHKLKIQEASVQWLKDRFVADSPFARTSLLDFDRWHHETCEAYCRYMNSLGFSFVMTYGRAQKVLNMTFKYLYCTSAYRASVEGITSFLHMTLDGYTLRWYKEVVLKDINANRAKGVPKLKVGDVSDWSKMNERGKHSYMDIQNRIRAYLSGASHYHYSINTEIIEKEAQLNQCKNVINVAVSFDPARKQPFFAEFIVWEGEIVRSKIEGLFKGLNATYKTWSKDEWTVNADIKAELKSKLSVLLKTI